MRREWLAGWLLACVVLPQVYCKLYLIETVDNVQRQPKDRRGTMQHFSPNKRRPPRGHRQYSAGTRTRHAVFPRPHGYQEDYTETEVCVCGNSKGVHDPWIVRLKIENSSTFNCVGSIIANQWVVTTASCVTQPSPPGTQNTVTVEYENNPQDVKKVNVQKIIPHEGYNSTTVEHDIALLQLAEPVDMAVQIPICLPASGVDYSGQTGSIHGFNQTTPQVPDTTVAPAPKIPDTMEAGFSKLSVIVKSQRPESTMGQGESTGGAQMLMATVSIVNSSVCQTAFNEHSSELPTNIKVGSGMICAGLATSDACQGDGGGPLAVANDAGHYQLAGLVSWGDGCGKPDLYGVYTAVSAYRTWLDQQLVQNGGATFCS